MKNNPESGHAKNIANFSKLISEVTSYGKDYSPTNKKIALTALQLIFTGADTSKTDLANAIQARQDAATARHLIFVPLGPLATRIHRSFISTEDVDQDTVYQVKSLVKKIHGERINPLAKPPATTSTSSPTPTPDPLTHSVSQKSYTNLTEHLTNLNIILSKETNYKPNEIDLKSATITLLTTDMVAKNNACDLAEGIVHANTNNRNTLLYTDTDGLVDLAKTVKDYVSSIYGFKSPQFKQVNRIRFTKTIHL